MTQVTADPGDSSVLMGPGANGSPGVWWAVCSLEGPILSTGVGAADWDRFEALEV